MAMTDKPRETPATILRRYAWEAREKAKSAEEEVERCEKRVVDYRRIAERWRDEAAMHESAANKLEPQP